MFALVRGGLLYAVDAIHEAHAIFQEAKGDLGSYWHGMMHRREGDFDNARYWFRRAGRAAVLRRRCTGAASEHLRRTWRGSRIGTRIFSPASASRRASARRKALAELVALQRVEFEALFDYCWRQSEATSADRPAATSAPRPAGWRDDPAAAPDRAASCPAPCGATARRRTGAGAGRCRRCGRDR